MQQFKRGNLVAALLGSGAMALAAAPSMAQGIERDGLIFDGLPADPVTMAAVDRYRGGESRFVDWLPDGSPRVEAGTPAALQRLASPLWTHDGRLQVVSARSGSNSDLYLVEAGSAALPRLIAGGGGTWRAEDWSRDDRQLLAVRDDATEGSRLQRVDLATGTVQRLGASTTVRGKARITQARFTPSGDAVLYLSDEDSEFTRLRRLQLDSGAVTDLMPPRAQDIELFAISPNGRLLAYAYNSNGSQRLVLRDLPGGRERLVNSLPGGAIGNLRFDLGGERLALDLESDFAPREVYLIDCESTLATRWTHSSPGAASAAMRVQWLRFQTWDRVNGRPRELLARVYRPATGGVHPLLIWLPGGDGQPRDRYEPLLQYLLAEQNYVVVMPALRGSGGSGRSFAALDDGALRDDPVRDLGSLLVWAGLQPDLDRSRMTILGSGNSAGLALNSLLQYGDRLRAAIVIGGQPALPQPQALDRPVLMLRGEMPGAVVQFLQFANQPVN